VTWYLKPWCLPGEIMTDMYYPIYAEGLYDALMQVRLCTSSLCRAFHTHRGTTSGHKTSVFLSVLTFSNIGRWVAEVYDALMHVRSSPSSLWQVL
jgi:hypothetical protein